MAIDLSKLNKQETPLENLRSAEQISTPELASTATPKTLPTAPAEIAPTASTILVPETKTTPAGEQSIDELYKKVDDIMSEKIRDLYKTWPVAVQQAIKLNGENTAQQITALLRGPIFPAEQVDDLIVKWLQFAPHIKDHPWLEQIAKTITDKLIALNEIERQL